MIVKHPLKKLGWYTSEEKVGEGRMVEAACSEEIAMSKKKVENLIVFIVFFFNVFASRYGFCTI